MIINVWTTNESKLNTVKELDWFYDWFVIDKLVPCKVDSGITDQPMSMEETIYGARNRAKNAYHHTPCDLAIGIESGIMKVDWTNTWYMACEIVVIRDGEKFYMWIWWGIEYPKKAMERIISHGEELNVAFKSAGFSEEYTGDKNGAIWFLTDNKLTRKEYSKQVLIYALSQLHNKHLY